MHSDFDPKKQESNIDSKIVASLERISQAFRVLLWNESKEHSLSPIQIQILIFIHYHSADLCTVSMLAKEFNMTKATISDCIKILLEKKLIKKKNTSEDQRSFQILLSPKGKDLVLKANGFSYEIKKPIEKLSENEKSDLLLQLINIIRHLQSSGIIQVQRMCFTCQHYQFKKDQIHFCNLLNSRLKKEDIRIDCPEHLQISN